MCQIGLDLFPKVFAGKTAVRHCTAIHSDASRDPAKYTEPQSEDCGSARDTLEFCSIYAKS